MRIKNETHWRTDDIRRYIVAALRHEGQDPREPWSVHIFYTKRRNDVMGYAYLNSRRFRIGLPRRLGLDKIDGRFSIGSAPFEGVRYVEIDELPAFVRRRVLQVTIHEIGHCTGLQHADMMPSRNIPTDFFDVHGHPIRKKAVAKPKPREAAARDDLAHAEKKLAETIDKVEKTETYLRRLKTLRSKWRSEVRRAKRRKTED